jgi:Tfp pilus assembly protein PilP
MDVRKQATALAIALWVLGGCGDRAAVGPTTQDFTSAREEKAAKLAKNKGKQAPVAQTRPRSQAPEAPAETSFGAVGPSGFHYDAANLRDPFRSFEWEQLALELSDALTEGPLEKFDVGQLSLVGVVWNATKARALIQDPSGMSYIVAEGTKIGKSNGRVTQIDDNLVVVQETYVDSSGETTTKDIEMRIRATEGG